MTVLILGLLLFLGAHSVRIFADGWRARQVARLGEGKWKGVYSVVSAIGFVLIVWGYGLARADPVFLWSPPLWTRHVAGLLTVPAFILLAAAYVPGNRIKAKVGHPMVAGVKVWAFAHLLANGTLAAVVLFGAFLVWAVAEFASARGGGRHCLPSGLACARRGVCDCGLGGLGDVRLPTARVADRRAAVRLSEVRAATASRDTRHSLAPA
jgi:uncharacterized membrane protein